MRPLIAALFLIQTGEIHPFNADPSHSPVISSDLLKLRTIAITFVWWVVWLLLVRFVRQMKSNQTLRFYATWLTLWAVFCPFQERHDYVERSATTHWLMDEHMHGAALLWLIAAAIVTGVMAISTIIIRTVALKTRGRKLKSLDEY